MTISNMFMNKSQEDNSAGGEHPQLSTITNI